MLKATISKKGQISIPAVLRKRLNLREGDKLVFEESEGALILRTLPQNPALSLRGRFKDKNKDSEGKKLTAMLLEERRKDRRSEKWNRPE